MSTTNNARCCICDNELTDEILTVDGKQYHYKPCFVESQVGLIMRRNEILRQIRTLEYERHKIDKKLALPLTTDNRPILKTL